MQIKAQIWKIFRTKLELADDIGSVEAPVLRVFRTKSRLAGMGFVETLILDV